MKFYSHFQWNNIMKLRAVLGMLSIIGLFANPARAMLLNNGHAYTQYVVRNKPLHGLYFVSQNTGEDLQNLNAPPSFITKEGWLVFSDSNGGEWIETGTVNGSLQISFTDHTLVHWHGFYVAVNGCGGVTATQCSNLITYNEGEVGSPVVNGKHSFLIRKMTDSSGNYQVYIDNTPITKFNSSLFTVPDPIGATIGFESNDTTNSFTSGTVIYDFWIVDPDNENNPATGGWYPVTPSIAKKELINNYNGANIQFYYPYNNGGTLPAGAVTQSNRFIFTHN